MGVIDNVHFTVLNTSMALNKSDLKQIRVVLQEELNNQEEGFEKKLTEVKSEFFEKIDPILKEVVTAREERPLLENRLEALEEIHPQGKHALVS